MSRPRIDWYRPYLPTYCVVDDVRFDTVCFWDGSYRTRKVGIRRKSDKFPTCGKSTSFSLPSPLLGVVRVISPSPSLHPFPCDCVEEKQRHSSRGRRRAVAACPQIPTSITRAAMCDHAPPAPPPPAARSLPAVRNCLLLSLAEGMLMCAGIVPLPLSLSLSLCADVY